MGRGKQSQQLQDGRPIEKRDVSKPTQRDVAFVHGRTADKKGYKILRRTATGRMEAGEVRPLESGKMLRGEVVRLKPRPSFPLLCDVEVQYSPGKEERPASAGGPPMVATRAYREGWEQIWGSGAYKRNSKPN